MSTNPPPRLPLGVPNPLRPPDRPPASLPASNPRPRKRRRLSSPHSSHSIPSHSPSFPSTTSPTFPSLSSTTSSSTPSTLPNHHRNPRTLYSAVSGRATTRRADTDASTFHPVVGAPLTPWESLALTSRKAPERYEEPELDCWDFQRWLPERRTYGGDVYKDGVEVEILRERWTEEAEGLVEGGETGSGKRDGRGDGEEQVDGEDDEDGQLDEEEDDTEKGLKNEEPRSFLRNHEPPSTTLRRTTGLPSDDITKALLRYTSYFYHAMHTTTPPHTSSPPTNPDQPPMPRHTQNHSLHSLDETALLALSILMEESARAVVLPKPSASPTTSTTSTTFATSADATPNPKDTPFNAHAADQPEGWRALMVGLKSERDEDALDVVDGTGMGVIRGGWRMRRDRRDWERRKRRRAHGGMDVGDSGDGEESEFGSEGDGVERDGMDRRGEESSGTNADDDSDESQSSKSDVSGASDSSAAAPAHRDARRGKPETKQQRKVQQYSWNEIRFFMIQRAT